MTIERELKRLVYFDINNKTDIKIINSCYLVYENQEYFKNGKPKGASWSSKVYYFFDNAKNYDIFMNKYELLPKSMTNITMVVDEGLKYDKDFLIKNLNKI
jgi:hypothetical protein